MANCNKFFNELLSIIDIESPQSILYIGPNKACLPLIKLKWPQAIVLDGVDANRIDSNQKFDLILSTQTFQSLSYPNKMIKELTSLLNEKACIAIQMPVYSALPIQICIDKMLKAKKWEPLFAKFVDNKQSYSANFGYELLSPYFENIDIRRSSYYQAYVNHFDIAIEYLNSNRTEYLDMLESDELKQKFIEELADFIGGEYKLQTDRQVLFSEKHIFAVGTKK